jgi:hypothetical protein
MSIVYTAPPTVAKFLTSPAFIRFIIGPIGSGKTTGVLIEILRRGIEQAKGPDGIRRTRWAIVRQTLSQLRMTILLDLLSWFRLFATYRVSEQLVILEFNDVRVEIYLIPLEEEEDQKRLLSMQLTAAAVNEFTEISPDLVGGGRLHVVRDDRRLERPGGELRLVEHVRERAAGGLGGVLAALRPVA